jgi:hypothetical protein
LSLSRQVAKRVGREGRHQPEALPRMASQIHDQLQNFSAFDMLGDTRDAKNLAQADYSAQEAFAVRAVLRSSDEPAIELDLVEPYLSKITD